MANLDNMAAAVAAKAQRSLENRANAHNLTAVQRKQVRQQVAKLLSK